MIGELLEHVRTRFDLALLQLRGNFDPFGRFAGAIFESAFQREIDEAADLLAVPDRNLPGDERRNAHRLKGGQQVAHPAVRLIDTVNEDEMRNAELVERAERRRGERGSSWVGVDDHNGDVGNCERPRAVGGKADRAGAIDDARTGRRDTRNCRG